LRLDPSGVLWMNLGRDRPRLTQTVRNVLLQLRTEG